MRELETHRTVLGILFAGLGIFGLIGISVVLFIFSLGTAIISLQEPQTPWLITYLPASFGALIALVIAVTTLPNFIAAYGLLKSRPWSGVAGLLIGILNIPAFPLGTAVAVYGIWYFFQTEGRNRMASP